MDGTFNSLYLATRQVSSPTMAYAAKNTSTTTTKLRSEKRILDHSLFDWPYSKSVRFASSSFIHPHISESAHCRRANITNQEEKKSRQHLDTVRNYCSETNYIYLTIPCPYLSITTVRWSSFQNRFCKRFQRMVSSKSSGLSSALSFLIFAHILHNFQPLSEYVCAFFHAHYGFPIFKHFAHIVCLVSHIHGHKSGCGTMEYDL